MKNPFDFGNCQGMSMGSVAGGDQFFEAVEIEAPLAEAAPQDRLVDGDSRNSWGLDPVQIVLESDLIRIESDFVLI